MRRRVFRSERMTDMALYESLDHQNLSTPTAANAARRQLRQRSVYDWLVWAVRVGLVGLLLACWVGAAYAGIVYWSFQGSLLGVVVSALVSGGGALSTWWLFTELESR
jgi:hypothetical protein